MRRFMRVAAVSVALALPTTAVLTLGISGTAGAKKVDPVPTAGSHVVCAKVKLKIKSKTKKGKTTTTQSFKVSKCYDAAGSIAGASLSSPNATALEGGGPLTWNTGQTTTLSAPGSLTTSQGSCPAGSTEYTDSGASVTASTQSLTPVGDDVSGSVCIKMSSTSTSSTTTGTIAPGTYFEL
jgi:hypothetical protein